MLKNKKTSQKGNVFFLILIGVFLFGALAFTFTRSGQQGTNNISKQQAKVAAQEILNYARLVEGAVDRVRRNGCSESEISFENSTVSGYTNSNAPADNSCHIFHDNGGKIEYSSPVQNSTLHTANIRFIGVDQILGIGNDCANSSCSELYIFYRTKSFNLCKEINALVGINLIANDIPLENGLNGSPLFTGSFTYNTNPLGDDNDGTSFVGKQTGCIKDANESGFYDFYHVLLAR
ncbi:MAG: hypothetical protein MRY79_01750 [Alphaproteobacteria bacterium]|nr:hypothetical protein [Alphaproteobacteria bacterium]